MTVRFFLFISFLATLIGAGAATLVITSLDPSQAGPLGFILLFLSLFVTVAGLTSILGYLARRLLLPKTFVTYLARISLRQGIIISTFFTILLFLQLLRLYRWWIAVILLVILLCLELVFSSYDRPHTQRSHPPRR